MCSWCYRYAPSKRWHIDTIMRVLTTVRISQEKPSGIAFCSLHDTKDLVKSNNRPFQLLQFQLYCKLLPLLIVTSAHPYRREATCVTIPCPTSSNLSPTVWRCTPTQYRDFTKRCWTTSPRYKHFWRAS